MVYEVKQQLLMSNLIEGSKCGYSWREIGNRENWNAKHAIVNFNIFHVPRESFHNCTFRRTGKIHSRDGDLVVSSLVVMVTLCKEWTQIASGQSIASDSFCSRVIRQTLLSLARSFRISHSVGFPFVVMSIQVTFQDINWRFMFPLLNSIDMWDNQRNHSVPCVENLQFTVA